jgi:hypothetical protein
MMSELLPVYDIEQMFHELWGEVDPAASRTMLMRRDTFEMLFTAYRSGVRRRARVRPLMARYGILKRGVQVREHGSKRDHLRERQRRTYGWE